MVQPIICYNKPVTVPENSTPNSPQPHANYWLLGNAPTSSTDLSHTARLPHSPKIITEDPHPHEIKEMPFPGLTEPTLGFLFWPLVYCSSTFAISFLNTHHIVILQILDMMLTKAQLQFGPLT
jgi:hypothetical protein